MRILLIEDNPGDVRLLREYLAEGGVGRFEVTHVDRLSAGLQRLAETSFDVLLLDLSLSDSQGMDTLMRMHEAAKSMPTVVLTGIEDETLGVQLLRAGAQDYLVKGQVTGPFLARSLRYAVERKQMEDRLADTVDRVRTLSRRLEMVREQERTRIARDLHDQLGVRLTCLKLDLARLQSLMRESVFPLEKMAEKIRSMSGEVDTTIASVQRLGTELRPGILDDLGLVAAIEWQCWDFEQRSGIQCVCTASQEEITLDRAPATAAFRICQEALTNVVRHARATHIRVLVEKVNGDLLLEIQDDGEGIPAEKLADTRSFGLLGMQERASGLGGWVEIAGRPGQGTTVTLRLPCSETAGMPTRKQADE